MFYLEETCLDIAMGKDILDKTPKTQEMKVKLNKCHFIS
jgi:hypothetical protein